MISHWPYFLEREAYRKDYIEHNIKHFESSAIFTADDPTKPIAWELRYPYGLQGNLFTLEEYRRRGFATIVQRDLSKKVVAKGHLPLCGVAPGNPNTSLIQKLGFIEVNHLKSLVITERL